MLKLIDKLEDVCLGETYSSDLDKKNPIAKFTNSEEDSIGKIFYDQKANITILDFYDGKYLTSIAFKGKQDANEIIYYHFYHIVKNN
jgi:hypothetical protein